jgi:hypothetical protein
VGWGERPARTDLATPATEPSVLEQAEAALLVGDEQIVLDAGATYLRGLLLLAIADRKEKDSA